ncbi:unnamed protein product [Diplocarpon coronariae]
MARFQHRAFQSCAHNSSDTPYNEWLKLCWTQQECGECLGTRSAPCSWCPSSGACIPNPSHPQLLAPFSKPYICPLSTERWELRTKALGCNISTITILAWARRAWSRRGDGWWGFWREWRLRLVNTAGRKRLVENDEQRPLLGAEG